VRLLAGAAAAALAYGWFEAGWLRTRVLETPVDGLPEELDGLRVAHLSDFHLGVPSRGALAVERAVEWVAERRPDLVCITGDLVSRQRGEPALRRVLSRLGPAFAVLGNHDFADSRDPFSEPVELGDLGETELLLDEARVIELRGRPVQVVGLHPRSRRRASSVIAGLIDPAADLRIVLTHFPELIRARAKPFELVLAGHMHGGQIVLPYPGGRVLFAHPRARESMGLYRSGGTIMHVSPGLGTTFVPFRFFARPEVTELVLRRG
jgi:uncharacterized protein